MKDKIETDDVGKTGTLLALGNALLAPLWWLDAKVGFGVAIAGTTAFLYTANEVGKKRRPIENAANNANSFFGGQSNEVQNTLANISVGGAAIFDEIFPESKNSPK